LRDRFSRLAEEHAKAKKLPNTRTPHRPTDNRQLSADSTAKAAALLDRSLRFQSELSAVVMPAGDPGSDFRPLFLKVLASQHPDGSFGTDESSRQKPYCTAQMITSMARIGISYHKRFDDENRATLGKGYAVLLAARWLVRVQSNDGGWGEDAWNTCQVLLALHLCGYRKTDPCVRRALTLLHDAVDDDWPDRSSYWFGPSFHGAALEVFNAYGDAEYARRTLAQIWEFWDDDAGCFRSPNEIDGQHAPAEWQTACAISGLRSFGAVSPEPERIDRAFAWLVRAQSPEGCWSPGHPEVAGIYTVQAIRALMLAGHPRNLRAALAGTQWLIEILEHEHSAAVEYMAAAAIARTRADELVTKISFNGVEEICDLLAQYRELAETLGNEAYSPEHANEFSRQNAKSESPRRVEFGSDPLS